MINIAIFASGSGSNAEKIVSHLENSNEISVKLILCNKPEAGVFERAKRLGMPCTLFDRQAYNSGEVLATLKKNKIDWVVLAGFLWLIPPSFVEEYPNRIINLHPALLPKYGGKGMYGHFVHEAVVAAGEKESGITIHFVNEKYDEGSIIFQASFNIKKNDTAADVAGKGQKLEHEHLPKVIEAVILDNLDGYYRSLL